MKLVVLAEDDDDLRETLREVLTVDGYRVTDLEDGFELLDYVDVAAQKRPDLILSDVNMPGVSGLEAVEKARAAGLTCPVIMMTVRVDPEMAARAAKISNTRLMVKPSNVEDLLKCVRDVVRQEPAPRS